MKGMLKQVVALSLLLSIPAVFAADVATGQAVPRYKRALSATGRGLVSAKNAVVRGAKATGHVAVRAGSAAKVKAIAAGNYALNTKAGKFVWNNKDSRKVRAAKVTTAVVATGAAAYGVHKAYKRFTPACVQASSFNPLNWPSMVYNKAKGLVSKKQDKTTKAHVAQANPAKLTPAEQVKQDEEIARALQAAINAGLTDAEIAEDAQVRGLTSGAKAPVTSQVIPSASVAPAVPLRSAMKQQERRAAAQQPTKRHVTNCVGGSCKRVRFVK